MAGARRQHRDHGRGGLCHLRGGDAWLTAWGASSLNLIYRTGRWSDVSFTALQQLQQVQADGVNARVIAFNCPDEIDLFGHPAQPGYGGSFDRSQTAGYMDQEIAEHRMVAPTKPFFANISGYNTSLGLPIYASYYLNDPNINWWATDQYPNVGTPAGFLMPFQAIRSNSSRPASACRSRRSSSRISLRGRRPACRIDRQACPLLPGHRADGWNPGAYEDVNRWRCIAWSGIINGAIGHCYFPQYPTRLRATSATIPMRASCRDGKAAQRDHHPQQRLGIGRQRGGWPHPISSPTLRLGPDDGCQPGRHLHHPAR
jgi:hypothetical protein